MLRHIRWLGCLAGLLAVGLLLLDFGGPRTTSSSAAPAGTTPAEVSARSALTQRYEYVLVDHEIYVYDIGHGQRLVAQLRVPQLTRVRGVAADVRTHMLYVSHGGDGGSNGDGSLLKYNLITDRVVWDRHYRRGIDSFSLSRDGARIYMPDGELSADGNWYVLEAASGRVIGRITGGRGPHNTVAGLSGKRVYLGGRNYNYLTSASTRTNRVLRRIGPLLSGVRPFTINGRETLAYTTATGFLGFQVSSVATGRVLYTETFGSRFRRHPGTSFSTAPSHGISLSPDERQLWVIDTPNAYVHVFDVRGVPRRAPRRIADIKLSRTFAGQQSRCSLDCERSGWLQHTLSGCLVYVGDSGDVLSSVTLKRVGYVPALRDSREFLEIDWRGGVPVATSTRTGLGYVTSTSRPPARCS